MEALDIILVAGVSFGGHRAGVLNASGNVIYADSGTAAHAGRVIGVSTGAAESGAAVTLRTRGEITEPSWSWDTGLLIWLGLNGVLTQTPPASGFNQVIGFPVTAAKMFVDIRQPIILE